MQSSSAAQDLILHVITYTWPHASHGRHNLTCNLNYNPNPKVLTYLTETCSKSATVGVESSTFVITRLSKSGVSGHSTSSSFVWKKTRIIVPIQVKKTKKNSSFCYFCFSFVGKNLEKSFFLSNKNDESLIFDRYNPRAAKNIMLIFFLKILILLDEFLD